MFTLLSFNYINFTHSKSEEFSDFSFSWKRQMKRMLLKTITNEKQIF